MQFYLALFISKFVYLLLKMLNRPATSFAGLVALKICPDFLSYARRYIKGNYISITGTNGKTTTSCMIATILSQNGRKIIANTEGANMLTGIVNTFALNLFPFKYYDNAVIETDEAFLTKVHDFIKTDMLVVTNLFKDQIDRYGSVDYIKQIIDEAIQKNKNLKLFLNADNEEVKSLGNGKNAIYYSLNDETADYKADAKVYDNYTELTVKHNDITDVFTINLPGLYNAYNGLSAICVGFENGLNNIQIQSALDMFKAVFGRAETKNINGKEVFIQLIKNAAGANEVIETVDMNSNIIIAINNTVSDGRDASWIWDTNFEKFQNATKPITVCGMCANDLAKRLEHAGIPSENILIENDTKKALNNLTKTINSGEKITVLPSYTVMWDIYKH